jgi:hypothetical protein
MVSIVCLNLYCWIVGECYDGKYVAVVANSVEAARTHINSMTFGIYEFVMIHLTYQIHESNMINQSRVEKQKLPLVLYHIHQVLLEALFVSKYGLRLDANDIVLDVYMCRQDQKIAHYTRHRRQ